MNTFRKQLKLTCIAMLTIFAFTVCGRGIAQEAHEDSYPVDEEAQSQVSVATQQQEIPLTQQREHVQPLQQSLTLQDLLGIAHQRRLGIYTPSIERLVELTHGRPPRTIDLENGFQQRVHNRRSHSYDITAQEAVHDVQLFFEVLREAQGAYTLFGGDEVFLPLFEEILEQLSSKEYWERADIESLVYTKLMPYIYDGHGRLFFGRGNAFLPTNSVFANSSAVFDRTANGFRSRGNELYVREIIGRDLEDVFRITVDQYGNFLYTPVIETTDNGNNSINIVMIYESGESSNLELFTIREEILGLPRDPSLRFVDGFPVVTIDSMHFEAFDESEMESANTFLSFVDDLRDEPAIIIDLRRNGGGNRFLAPRWIYNLLGEFVPENNVYLTIGSYDVRMERIATSLNPNSWFYQPMCEIRSQETHIALDDNHVISFPTAPSKPGTLISNDQIIIFLTSSRSASATELFLDLGFNIENTLVIGHNTAGALLSSICYPSLYLPYTGINFGFGSRVIIHADAHNWREGVGIAPDLWVLHNADALPAALALLRNHFSGTRQ